MATAMPDPVPPDDTAVSDPQQMPSGPSGELASEQLTQLETLYDESFQETVQVLGSILDNAESAIDNATADVVRITAEVSGSAYQVIEPHISLVGAIVDRVIGDTSKSLDRMADTFNDSGLNYPYDVAVQSEMLDTDPIEWVPAVVPQFGEMLNIQVSSVDPGPTGPVTGCYATIDPVTGDTVMVGDCAGTVPPASPPPPPPPQSPLPPIHPCDIPDSDHWSDDAAAMLNAAAGFAAWYADGPDRVCTISWNDPLVPPDWPRNGPYCIERSQCPPSVPAVPPPPPLLPPPDSGGSQGQCCPPQQITVIVPPVPCATVPPAYPPPPGSPPVPPAGGGTSPPPPVPPTSPAPPPLPAFPPVPQTADAGWSSPAACSVERCVVTSTAPPPDPAATISSEGWFTRNFGWLTTPAGVGTFLGGLGGIFTAGLPSLRSNSAAGAVARHAVDAVAGSGWVRDFFQSVVGSTQIAVAPAMYYGTRIMAAEMAERLTGFPTSYLSQSLRYSFQYCNPQILPEQPGIDKLYLTSRITDAQWECATKAHGNLPEWHRLVRDASVGRPNESELVTLLLRGHLDIQTFRQRMADIGWINPGYQDDLRRLSIQLPGQPDLLRFMVRDVADPAVVEKYGYDTEFTDKFKGQLRAWAQSQGIPEEIFLYYWRAHWQIPPATQLREMLARCRPDRASYADEYADYLQSHAQWEAGGEIGDEPQPPSRVTTADVEEALKVNDLAPGWVTNVMRIMTRPITNSDAIRAYILGAFDEQKLYEVFRDNEYSDRDARTLVEYWKSQAVQRVANQSGVLTQRAISKLYREGSIDRQEADHLLQPLMPNRPQRQDMIDRLDISIAAESTSTAVKGIRQQFHTAALDIQGAIAKLEGYGVDPGQAARLAHLWEIERDTKGKQASVSQLCKWHSRGLIDAAEMFRRLRIIGYSEPDANRIVLICEQDETIRREKAAVASYRASKKVWDDAIKVLVALDPSLAELLNPLIGKPPQSGGSASGGGPKK